ncbi:MFS transporter [Naasia lichenicola]|uniref:MFS transporter n=1 Tax=Naasia lichenicola TaxID=2565933 RepID=A0A4S4FMP0_9MICO|nr:MFS transporter [Naasia lichenicola]THG31082.1 MFS transporter [Naasia lichenicola]
MSSPVPRTASHRPSLTSRRLGPGASFWTAAVVAGLALWASAAPTVVYPLYAARWDLTPTVTTAIFAIYPIVLIPVLLVFGGLSDVIGRRATILTGLGILAAGCLAFAVAPDLGWVLAGRALMGAGVGLSLSPATAAMIDFGGPSRAHRASSTTTAATATGLALATLVGGALVQYAPAPMHLSFWVLFAAAVATFGVALFLPGRTAEQAAERWRPRRMLIPAARGMFAAGALGISAAYTMGAIFLALGAQIARELVRSDNAFADGAIIAISAVMIGVVAVLARSLSPVLTITIGPIAATVGLGLLIAAGAAHSLPLFIASSVVAGTGYSLLFSGGLGLVSRSAPAEHRGAVLSAAYVIGYFAQAAGALALGALATSAGLLTALEIGSPVILVIGVLALVLANLGRRRALTT